ncbi:PspA/IM30 family protein [Evansella tamaricis]|uniref:PspA/IM30 family protein n=1 Tax=Evansella tamaricis TaxID=2069301 RepID=A0ABS6JC51_9BACI|nr:PspA/IM30 family protein [Evansella tamaricis]MBU9711000.1 PspA/IM30 family protein [Evansella tamaricis]
MTNLFTRMKDAIAEDMEDLVGKKDGRNPIVALNQYLRQSEQETEKVRKLVERQYRLHEEFTKEYEQVVQMASKRKHQADVAQKAGEEAMYQFAVREMEAYEEKAIRLKVAKEESEEQLQILEQKYEEMMHKLKDMKYRQLELMGKENLARATQQMEKVVGGAMSSSISEQEDVIQGSQENGNHFRNSFDSRIAKLEEKWNEKEDSKN